jgi:cell division protein FtsL
MSDTERDLAVHVAVCDQRYKEIVQALREGEKRMTKIEYLLYGVMIMVLLGPGVAGQFFHKFFGM